MLTTQQLEAILGAVTKDAEAGRRIDSNLDNIFPDSWGLAGGSRNMGYVLGNIFSGGLWGDPSEPEFANRVCTGIADATAASIQKSIDAKAPGFEGMTVTTIDRKVDGTHHTATQITTADGQVQVLDWHQTLSAENPMVYPDASVWSKGGSGTTAEEYIERGPDAVALDGAQARLNEQVEKFENGEGSAREVQQAQDRVDQLQGRGDTPAPGTAPIEAAELTDILARIDSGLARLRSNIS